MAANGGSAYEAKLVDFRANNIKLNQVTEAGSLTDPRMSPNYDAVTNSAEMSFSLTHFIRICSYQFTFNYKKLSKFYLQFHLCTELDTWTSQVDS